MSNDESGIYTSQYKRGDVSVRLSYPTGSAGKRVATLLVTDKPSGQTLVEVDLSAEDLMELMGGSTAHLSGATLPMHPDRIGRRSQNTSTSISYGDLPADLARGHVDDFDTAAERVKAKYLTEGWEAVRIDRTNYGRNVVAYRWIDDDE